MHKEELRLAVVIYGGASLAVYMHGVTKELFKVVRASKQVRDARKTQDPASLPGTPSSTETSEDIYREIIERINTQREYRVVIDVIAGASAGAINGAMLAKALAFDLPLDKQTDVWLKQADVDQLSIPPNEDTGRWYLVPIIKALIHWLPEQFRRDPETQQKLEKFLRLAWLRPPLSGERLCHLILDVLEQEDSASEASLLPYGQRLDFYASITDLFGYPRKFRLNDTTTIQEQEHAAVVRLVHVETPKGRTTSDLSETNNPALVWAARASSSFAGAFPPFHHSELTTVLAERGREWDAQAFLERKVLLSGGQPAHEVFDPADRHFVDGGIVNNKPFAAALEALHHRPADRLVDRCVLYIEPTPNKKDRQDPQRFLKFFGTIRAAASNIPRNQPILSELTEFAEVDSRARINQRLVSENRDVIDQLVKAAAPENFNENLTLTPAGLRSLRTQLSVIARDQMGIAFEAYVQRRSWRLIDALVGQWRLIMTGIETEETERSMLQSVTSWFDQEQALLGTKTDPNEPADKLRPHLSFVERFDVTFRIRRLQFVIRSLNMRVRDLSESTVDEAAIGALKLRMYDLLQTLYGLRRAQGLQKKVLDQIQAASHELPVPPRKAITVLRVLSRALRLNALDAIADETLCHCLGSIQDAQLRSSIFSDYAGFAVYDMLITAAGSEMRDSDPLTRLRIERVSPADSTHLREHFHGLQSEALMSFAGFFNRGYREHDYLWGRLNGADRVIKQLARAADRLYSEAEVEALRLRLFNSILRSERPKLTNCEDLIDSLIQELQP